MIRKLHLGIKIIIIIIVKSLQMYIASFFSRELNTFANSFAHYSKEGDDKDIIFLVFLTSGEIRVGLVELH